MQTYDISTRLPCPVPLRRQLQYLRLCISHVNAVVADSMAKGLTPEGVWTILLEDEC